MASKIDWITLADNLRKEYGDLSMTEEQLKQARAEANRKKQELDIDRGRLEKEIREQAMKDAMALDQVMHPEKYGVPPGVQTAKVEAETAGERAQTGLTEAEIETERERPGLIRAQVGATEALETQREEGAKAVTLTDIVKTYRKDFIHPDAQTWFNSITSAVQGGNWDEFMRLGQGITELENTISQGVAGTSEAVKSQISSATAVWSTIYENLYPQNLRGATTVPATTIQSKGAGAAAPADIEGEVQSIIDLYTQGKIDEANRKYQLLIKSGRVPQTTIDAMIQNSGG